jgi:uncharacterized membrane protein YedE/YeeE
MDLQDAALLLGSLALIVGAGLMAASASQSTAMGIGAGLAIGGILALALGLFGLPIVGRRPPSGDKG